MGVLGVADLGEGLHGETHQYVRVSCVVDVWVEMLVFWPRRSWHAVAR